MSTLRLVLPLVMILMLVPAVDDAQAQQGCPVPPFSPPPREKLMFSEKQEQDLGDVIAQQLESEFRVIQDEEITGKLQRIGEHIAAQYPQSTLKFRFVLVDVPIVNAWGMPGGRVYVTRKLVASSKSEDELAGVLAHELGHLVTRQPAVGLTRAFQKVLGVNEVGDRKDIEEKYHQFLDNIARKPGAMRMGDVEEGQLVADQVAVYLGMRAGYDPNAYAEFWDRTAETKGKTGSAFGDFFGFTKPEQKRLREIRKLAAALPPACAGPRAARPAEEYNKWKEVVVAYSGLGRKESLGAVISRKVLEPPLQDDIDHIKFSTDGKYVLAQNDSSIYVMTREPFEAAFRIDAPEAKPANFTPDSQAVVFYTQALRVEKWDIAEEKRTGVHELIILRGCIQSLLSPDGKYLACLGSASDDAVNFDLTIFEVETDKPAFVKKNFFVPNLFQLILYSLLSNLEDVTFKFANMNFSPDGKYFVASSGSQQLGLEMTTMSPVSLPGSVKRLLGSSFTFYGSDRLLGVGGDKGEKSKMVKFPSGEELHTYNFGGAAISAPAQGNVVLLRPIDKFAAGLMDLETQKIFAANKMNALDVYDKYYVSERRTGELGLYSRDSEGVLARVTLPRGTLGRIRAFAISADSRYLALSQRSRGGVWDILRGERVFNVRGFRGAHFGEDGYVYADFPKFGDSERMMGRLDLTSRQAFNGPKIEEGRADQYGEYLVLLRPKKKDAGTNKDVTLEVRDVRSNNLLWSRYYPKERPGWHIGVGIPNLVLWWNLTEKHAKDDINSDPVLKARAAAMKEKEGDYLLEVVEAKTGKTLGKLLVETGKGSFHIDQAWAAGDWVVVADNENRVLVYSVSSNEQKARVFGTRVAVSPRADQICIENEPGKLSVYDMAGMVKRNEFTFTHNVSMVRFSSDGKKLFVLTSDQTACVLDVSAAEGKTAAK